MSESKDFLKLDSPTEQSNLSEVQTLLTSWGLEVLNSRFAKVTLNTFRYLTEIDLISFFPDKDDINFKCEFRNHLIKWRQDHGYQVSVPTLSESLSFNSSILSWIEQSNREAASPSTYTNVENINTGFVLKDFLQTTKGKKILDMCNEEKNILTNEAREILITSIVQIFMERNECMRPQDFQKIKLDIVSIFPKENGDFYYKGGKRPTGKLYNRYRNSACNLRKVGYFKGGKRMRFDEDVDTDTMDNESFQFNEGEDLQILESDKEWLAVCSDPWETVEIKWINTFKLRKKDVTQYKSTVEFLTEWPLLKSTNGFRLVEIDFKHSFKDKSFNKWQHFKERAPQVLGGHLKQSKAQKELRNLSPIEDIHNYQLFFLLHSALPPAGRTSKFKGEQKGYWKPSIEDSIKAFFLELEVADDLESELEKKRTLCKDWGLTLSPVIVVFKNVESKRYAVTFEDIFYTFDSVLSCIDICFKLLLVLNLEFPFECKNVWQFIQKYFYNINTSFDGFINSNVLSLISNFDSTS